MSQRLNHTQHPLQMSIRHPRLKLRLHMSAQKRLCPHQPALVMLYTHNPLRPIQSICAISSKNIRILQIRERNINRRSRLCLKPQLSAPSHVLDSEQGAIGDDDHIKVPIRDQHAVGGFDDLGQDFLDRVGGEVAFAFWPAGVVVSGLWAADEDAAGGAFGPGDRLRVMEGGFDVGPIKVSGCAFGGVDELGGEGEHVPEEGALLVDFVNVEAGVYGQRGVVDHAEDVAIGFAGEIEEFGGLVAGWGEGEVFFAESGVAAGLVERFEGGENGGVEVEDVLVGENVGDCYDFLLGVFVLANHGVVY